MKFHTLQFKGKLILVFAVVSLIPTVSLVLVSHLIITQSIDRWERLSEKLRQLSVLPMVEKAMEIASDPTLNQALETGTGLSGIEFSLPEDYILMIYDSDGEQVFKTTNEQLPDLEMESLGSVGLPSADKFHPWEPVIPELIKIHDKELALSAILIQSPENEDYLGVVVVGQVIPSAPSDIGSQTVIIVLAFTAILVFLIALWISSLIAREITEPIKKLLAGTQEVAGGDLDYQVAIEARDELGILADSFNQMTTKLRKNTEELKRAEKSAAWREIAQKLAHEIKNPLTPIQLSAERLKKRYYSNRMGYEGVLDECTETIIREVNNLRYLLDEFSRLARMPSANPIPSDINDIVNKALGLYGEFPDNIEVKTEYAADLPAVPVDPEQMERAFFNVIKNAVEAMIDGGTLTIRTDISHENRHIKVEFEDTGSGISADAMDKLFTPHFSTKKGGTGLGLAIVQKIVNEHNGDVTAKSEEGKGAIFTFMIPIY
jgi:nitrogen fixation/metabolism regulation signal transduction histidine kinase